MFQGSSSRYPRAHHAYGTASSTRGVRSTIAPASSVSKALVPSSTSSSTRTTTSTRHTSRGLSPFARSSTASQFNRHHTPLSSQQPSKKPVERPRAKPAKKKRAAPVSGTLVTHNDTTYEIGRAVGKGGFADVYKFTVNSSQTHRKGKVYAGKVIDHETLKSTSNPGSNSKVKRLQQEINIHMGIHNPWIVKLLDSFEATLPVQGANPPSRKKFHCIVLEYCNAGSLMDIVKASNPLLPKPAARIFLQIVSGVRYLHKNNIIHRDLKLGNIFLYNSNTANPKDSNTLEARIGDFGLATQVSENERRKTMCGTPNYIAPEIISKDTKVKAAGHSFEVDVWSLGVILYTLLVGTPPFQAANQDLQDTYNNINKVKYDDKKVETKNLDAKDLIARMLQFDPRKRASLDQIASHRFFNILAPEERSTIYPMDASFDRAPLQSLSSRQPRSSPYALTPARSSGVENSAPNHHRGRSSSTRGQAHPLPPSGDDDLAPIHRSLADGITAAKSNVLYAAAMKGSGATIPAPSNTKTEQSSPDTVGPARRFPENPASASLYVAKWVDFSDRYGLAYQLSDQTYGVYFNDATRIVLSADKTHGEYHPHVRSKEARVNPGLPTDRIVPFSMPRADEDESNPNHGLYPSALKKKVTLLKFFVKYMAPKPDEPSLPTPAAYVPGEAPLPYLKKWLRTKHGMLFRLSNRAVQLNFFDHSKIILDSAGSSLTYVHRETQERTTHNISDLISQPDGEILVRLKYIRDVLRYLLDFKNNKNSAAAAASAPSSAAAAPA